MYFWDLSLSFIHADGRIKFSISEQANIYEDSKIVVSYLLNLLNFKGQQSLLSSIGPLIYMTPPNK